MSILILVLILAVAFSLLLLWDIRNWYDPVTNQYKPHRASDSLIVFAPFSLLFYADNFWHNLLFYYAPFYAYCLLLAFILKRWKKDLVPTEMLMSSGVGSTILVIIIYYLFFHKGSMTEAPTEVVQTIDHPWWVWWPFAGIVLSAWITAVINSEKLIWVLGLVLLILPYFSHHPLWAMLLTVVAMFWCCFSMAQKQGNSAYVAFLMFYLMAQMVSVAIYAFFF